MSSSVFDRVESLLKQHGIVFQVTRHQPVYTSEEAAWVRGTPLASGAKALVCKGEEGFVMFVLPADRKVDSRAVRRAEGWKKCTLSCYLALAVEHTHGVHVVYEVLLTHPHFDHFAQLDWLSMCLLRSTGWFRATRYLGRSKMIVRV